jgi:tetratricopeptide (TPR) repeat protein
MIRRPSFYVVLVVWGLCHAQAEAGPKAKSVYPFQLPPTKVFDVLEDLNQISKDKVTVSKDERDLFSSTKDGKHPNYSFAETALIASGITNAARRQEYLKQIDQLEAAARKATAEAKTTKEKGEKLLKFLHAGPLAKGYAVEQTDLSAILDTNKFNCVSSAILYNILAKRLGMQARGVRVPNHVFSVLEDAGRLIAVETTSARGFDARRRQPKATISELELASSIYYNHGVALIGQKEFHKALVANFCALALDPEDTEAVRNARASLINWALDLERAGQFEHAIFVCEVGLRLDPTSGHLKNNIVAVYDSWARTHMDAGNWADAIRVYEQGLERLPGNGHLANNLNFCKAKVMR